MYIIYTNNEKQINFLSSELKSRKKKRGSWGGEGEWGGGGEEGGEEEEEEEEERGEEEEEEVKEEWCSKIYISP